MSSIKGGTVNAAPRKWKRKPNGAGVDQLIAGRAPASLIEAVKAKANARNVAYSVIVREALERYVSDDEGRVAA
jgi:predicted DNA binding CopG/RHH family protein